VNDVREHTLYNDKVSKEDLMLLFSHYLDGLTFLQESDIEVFQLNENSQTDFDQIETPS
jgi:hypothetical protein